MNIPDEKFLDDLLQILLEAPRTQIDEDIIADIKKFVSEKHTYKDKYDFIQNISNEPLNMISETVGVGRITPMVQLSCDLNKMFGTPTCTEPDFVIHDILSAIDNSNHPAVTNMKAYIDFDSEITVDYIKVNQEKEKHIEVMKQIMIYLDDLMWAAQFHVVDEFIEEFCNPKNLDKPICFQYYICVLTCANWCAKDLKKLNMLKEKALEVGIAELGEKETVQVLMGLI